MLKGTKDKGISQQGKVNFSTLNRKYEYNNRVQKKKKTQSLNVQLQLQLESDDQRSYKMTLFEFLI